IVNEGEKPLLSLADYLRGKNEDINSIYNYIRRQVEIITSRGCIHQCAFCINSVINNKYRDEPIEQTLKNIDILINDYKIEHIFFMDEDFFINRSRIRYLLSELKKEKLAGRVTAVQIT
ncbi:MAG: radical SAM protein, partial [Candidatus Omnitrophica bacterium]|nr:radical SAM protein [Candidatus Omnitrophota bacterium]